MKTWPLIALLLTQGLAWAQPGPPPCPEPLRVGFADVDFRPFLNGSGSEFAADPGIIVTDLRAVLASLGCKAEQVRLPARRLMADLIRGDIDMWVTAAYSIERGEEAVFPLTPRGEPDPKLALTETRVVYFIRRDRAAVLEPRLAERSYRDLRLGTVRGSVADQALMAMGVKPQDVGDSRKALEMLRRDRLDALVAPSRFVVPESLGEEPSILISAATFAQHLFFAPVSKQLNERHPAWVKEFWRRMCRNASARSPELPKCS
jgi:hypothetical protein